MTEEEEDQIPGEGLPELSPVEELPELPDVELPALIDEGLPEILEEDMELPDFGPEDPDE